MRHNVRMITRALLCIGIYVVGAQATAQDLDVFDEILARENIVGRWEGDKPNCLLTWLEAYSESRNGEIVFRRDGFVLGLPTEVKWAIATVVKDRVPQLRVMFWIKRERKYEECVERIDVSRKTLRFLNEEGSTYSRMRKTD